MSSTTNDHEFTAGSNTAEERHIWYATKPAMAAALFGAGALLLLAGGAGSGLSASIWALIAAGPNTTRPSVNLWQFQLLLGAGITLLVVHYFLSAWNQGHLHERLATLVRADRAIQSELQLANVELAAARRRMSVIESNLPGLVFERRISSNGTAAYPFFGGSLLSVLGLTPEQARNDPSRVLACIHPDDRRRWDALLQASEHACAGYADTFRIVGHTGEVFWAKCVASAQDDPESGTIWTGLWIDVSAQQAAREAADIANRAKDDLLATISHEIRTPLNAIIGFNTLLLDKPLSREERRYAALTRDAGSMLLWLVDQVLTYSKAEHTGLVSRDTGFALSDLIRESTALISPVIDAKSLLLEIATAPDVPARLNGDPEKLRQILVNLLSNAAKFTARGSVKLWVTRMDHGDRRVRLRFSVTDTGCGIAPERQGSLFERFSQAEPETGWRFGGTGLGLAICKRLVEHLGGKIGATSRPGAGSTFWFEVNLDIDHQAGDPTIDDGDPVGISASSSPARILVAEDLPLNRELILKLLEADGHHVDLVQNGAEAVEAAAEGSYDLVLMDVQMPVMDGLQATRAIRGGNGQLRGVPIVAITAGALESDLDRCRAAGMNAHVTKPLNKPDLLRVVREWAGRSSAVPEESEDEPSSVRLNRTVLEGLVERLGVESVLEHLRAFVSELPDWVGYTAQQQDGADMARSAHRLLGISGQLGFEELSQACRGLLGAYHEEGSSDVGPHVTHLHDALLRAHADGMEAIQKRFDLADA